MRRKFRHLLEGHKPAMFGLAAAGLLALLVALPTGLQGEATATVTTGALNVRTGPSPGHPVVAVVPQGETVVLLARNPGSSWAKVQTLDGVIGWLGTAFIESDTPLRLLPVENPPAAWAEVNTGMLNLRAGPGPGYPIIGKLQEKATMALVGRTPDSSWVQVLTGEGATGWVSRLYVNPSEAIRNLPVLADAQSWGVVDTGGLNVRSGPGPEYDVLGTLNQSAFMGLLARTEDVGWIYIRTDSGLEGWVTSEFVLPGGGLGRLINLPVYGPDLISALPTPLPAPVYTPPPVPSTVIMEGTISTGALVVRPAAGTHSGQISTVSEGSVVGLMGRSRSSEWLFGVMPDGTVGWIGSIGVTTERRFSVLPITDAHVSDIWGGAKVSAGALAVRTGPNTAYDQIGTVYQGDLINLLGRNESDSWVMIRTLDGSLSGWVAGGEIDAFVLFKTMPILSYPASDTYGIATVTAGALNLRAGPDTSAAILGTLAQRERAKIMGRTTSGAWIKVRTAAGLEGWVNEGEVSIDVPLYDLPVVP